MSAYAETGADTVAPRAPLVRRRSLWRLVRRRRWPALIAFCLVTAAILAMGPFLPRTYVATARLDRDERPLVDPATNQPWVDVSAAARSIEADLRTALAAGNTAGVNLPPERLTVQVEPLGPQQQRVTLEARANEPDRAYVALKAAVDRYLLTSRHKTADQLDAARDNLRKRLDQARQTALAAEQAVQAFPLAHPGVLPDDPNSVVNKLERTRTKLEDRQQRLKVLDEQILRLEQYAKRIREGGKATASQPAPGTPAPAVATDDPEVLQLRAQLNLLNEQVDEQLNTLRRTEQHPYVVDLRNKQAAMQKKLEAAQARAAAGKPPPPDIKPLPDNSKDLALQTVDMQVQQL